MLSRIAQQQPATSVRAFAAAAATGPRLDANGEPRFLEQVKLHFANAAEKTGIDKQYLDLI